MSESCSGTSFVQMPASTCLECFLCHSICTEAYDLPLPDSVSNKTLLHLQEGSDQTRSGLKQTSPSITDLLPPYLQELTINLLK